MWAGSRIVFDPKSYVVLLSTRHNGEVVVEFGV